MNQMIDFNEIGDVLCELCTVIMKRMSEYSGMSYGLVNILLFVILGPLSTLLFIASSVIACIKGRNKVSNILAILGILIVVAILVSIFIAFITAPIF